MWLGPAPWRPYNENHVHYNFRFFWDYSGGQMTNFGAHHLDIAQWGLGMDDCGPVSIEGTATFPKDKDLCEVTETCKITYTYANGVKIVLVQPQRANRKKEDPTETKPPSIEEAIKAPAGGVIFYGDKGTVLVDRQQINHVELQDGECFRVVSQVNQNREHEWWSERQREQTGKDLRLKYVAKRVPGND